MSRSDSRNSVNQDLNSPRSGGGGGGLSLASMGTGRHSAARAQTPSRRGSSVYIGGDDSGVFLLLFFPFLSKIDWLRFWRQRWQYCPCRKSSINFRLFFHSPASFATHFCLQVWFTYCMCTYSLRRVTANQSGISRMGPSHTECAAKTVQCVHCVDVRR